MKDEDAMRQRIVPYARDRGIRIHRLENPMSAGLPDLLLFTKKLTVFLELKKDNYYRNTQIATYSTISIEHLFFIWIYRSGFWHVGCGDLHEVKLKRHKTIPFERTGAPTIRKKLIADSITDFFKYLDNINCVC